MTYEKDSPFRYPHAEKRKVSFFKNIRIYFQANKYFYSQKNNLTKLP
ncbi:hypothetical protein HMPREF9148_01556 [Prevotella sp. F0091]|nr:hypothetical protein HMPREF9148_01556 [Prevotella sp. F0091]